MENCRIQCDRSGWEFRLDGEVIIGQIDSGSDDADYEWFVRGLGDLEAKNPDWCVTFPEKYKGQNGHYVDGARFMSVKRPDGRVTHMEFIYRRLPWKFVRSVESRYEEHRKGKLEVSPKPTLYENLKKSWRNDGQRQSKRRKRRNSKVT